jgi:hypothetical protein
MSHDNVTEDSGLRYDANFLGFPDGGPYHEWSVKRYDPLSNAGQTLKKYKDAFYKDLRNLQLSGEDTPFELIEEKLYHP